MMTLVMFVVFVVRAVSFAESLLTPERHHHHSRHVDRSQKGSERPDKPKEFAETGRRKTKRGRTPRLPQNLILRKETRKDRNTADRQPACQHRHKRNWHVLLETAHAA